MDAFLHVDEAIFDGESTVEATLRSEAYEGKVALHVLRTNAVDDYPKASLYLNPLDAAVYAERIFMAAKRAVEDPAYVP